MSDRVIKRLLDAVGAIDSIETFLGVTTLQEYDDDFGLQLQIERLLEIVGEALRQASLLDPGLYEQIPNLQKVIGLRNQITHGYDGIDNDIVWLAASQRAIELRDTLRQLVARSEATG